MNVGWSSLYKKEDWWALWLGLLIFLLGFGPFAGTSVLGWTFKSNVWLDPAKAVTSANPAYQWLGWWSPVLTFLFLLAVLSIGVIAMKYNLRRFIFGFAIIYWITAFVWVLGSFAYSAVTADQLTAWRLPWSLSLTSEGGFIYLLVVGLVIRNVFKGFAQKLEEAARPEWFIKTAIVILGASIGVKAVAAFSLATVVLFRGLGAIIEAYLIYWPLVYLISRKYFRLPKEWAAPLASGISICGVSAAIATGSAIKARPRIPIVLSSIVVAFAVAELIILPWISYALYPTLGGMTLGAWMGLAVKTDGAAAASGALVDALILGKAAGIGIALEKGWMLLAATTTKIFIDMFIGIWAFILAIFWSTSIERKESETSKKIGWLEIWFRFPKFIIGYFATFLVMLGASSIVGGGVPAVASGEMDALRVFFFALTFLSIGLITDLSAFRKEGLGKIVLIYLVCLFGFILWIGLFVSWIFYGDVPVPLARM
ncbi:MAG: putative sulfate exporter family transporter [archaeon]